MAMCLLWALCDANRNLGSEDMKKIDYDVIADYYKKWFKSDPFDIGRTT